jgi:hypothetical protein
MKPFRHLAANAQNPCAGIGGERLDDGAGLLDIGCRW